MSESTTSVSTDVASSVSPEPVDPESVEPESVEPVLVEPVLVEPVSPAVSLRRYRWGLAGVAALAVALRVRFMFSVLTVDEGGYLAIARAWSHGSGLYTDVFLDRPQGLLVVYRFWDFIAFGNTDSARGLALVFGAIGAVAVAEVVRMLRTPTAGIIAGVLAAVLSSAPTLEGYTANGELLSGAAGAVAVALGCAVLTGRLSGRWMVAAGVVAGFGMSMKQSGIDGFIGLAAWLVLAFVAGWMPRRLAAVRLGQVFGGFSIVIGVLAIHGAWLGWSQWWYSFQGYRAQSRSVFVNVAWDRLPETAKYALPFLVPLIDAALIGALLVVLHRKSLRMPRLVMVLPLWLLAAIGAFLGGGQFFRHYWIILTFPVAAIGGLVIGSVRPAWVRSVLLVGALVPPMISWYGVVTMSKDEIARSIDGRGATSAQAGEWLRHHMEPGDTLYVMCSRANIYAEAHADPVYPYLWLDGVHNVPGAVERMRRMLAAPDRPTWVIIANACDPQGIANRTIASHYEAIETIGNLIILKVDDDPTYR